MNTLLERIKKILDSKPVVDVYPLKKHDGELGLDKFDIENNVSKTISALILRGLSDFLNLDLPISDQKVLPLSEYDDTSRLYHLGEDQEEYFDSQFGFLTKVTRPIKTYEKLIGTFFKISSKEDYIWIFQNVPPSCITNTKWPIFSGMGRLEKVKGRVYQFTDTITFIIVDKDILFKKVGALQSKFGFDTVIEQKADKALNAILDTGFISNPDKLQEYRDSMPAIAKKLMRAENSVILTLPWDYLKSAIEKSQSYGNRIRFGEDGKIRVTSKEDMTNLLKLLNDQIVRSEITDNLYDAKSKETLESNLADHSGHTTLDVER